MKQTTGTSSAVSTQLQGETPEAEQKVSTPENKSVVHRNAAHKSNCDEGVFLIDVTISKVTVTVNHREVHEHRLSFTQDASVFSWGEL